MLHMSLSWYVLTIKIPSQDIGHFILSNVMFTCSSLYVCEFAHYYSTLEKNTFPSLSSAEYKFFNYWNVRSWKCFSMVSMGLQKYALFSIQTWAVLVSWASDVILIQVSQKSAQGNHIPSWARTEQGPVPKQDEAHQGELGDQFCQWKLSS